MKKTIYVLLTVFLLVLLTACNKVEKATNTISKAQLTEREEALLSVGNTNTFVFDFVVDQEYNWVDISVEKYEFGEKASSFIGMGSSLSKKDGMMIFGIRESKDNKKEWTVVLLDESATSTSEYSESSETELSEGFSKMWGINSGKISIKNDEEITLASISYKYLDSHGEMKSFTDNFYNDPEANKDQMKDYDAVYLLKCKFRK